MAVTRFVRAGAPSRGVDGDSDSRKIPWLAFGTDDDNEVLSHAEANTPTTYDLMDRGKIDVHELATDIWEVMVNYSREKNDPKRETPPGGTVEESFSIATTDEPVQHALTTIGTYPTAIDVAQAVKFNAISKQIDGLSAPRPQSAFSISFTTPNGYISASYRNAIEGLAGKVNDATFRGRDAGEVLFRGVEGQQNSTGESRLTFHFEVKKNRTVSVGNPLTIAGITVPNGTLIEGWEVIYPIYEHDEDATAKRIVPKAVALVHQRLIERADFTVLGF